MHAASPPEHPAQFARRPIRVWDLPTRIFHWLLVAAFVVQWITQDDARLLDYHVFAGYAIGVLLVFRVLWGFLGTRYARFDSFAFSPRQALQHLCAMLAGRHERHLGHNPAGTWSIFGLLALGLATVVTGIATLGGAKQLGPLRGLIGYARGDTFALVHKYLAWSMLVLVALHLLGVLLASRAEHENLVVSMVVGTKSSNGSFGGVPAATPVASVLLVILAIGVWSYFRGYLQARPLQPYLPFTQPALAENAAWTKECGGCHLAYHPSILPARSWTKLLREQHAHFGEDLDLEDESVRRLQGFAAMESAEAHRTTLAWKVDSTTPSSATPLRVTDTGYWKHRHADLSDADWTRTKRFACDGCHLDAAAGTFLPGAIQVGMQTASPEKVR